jgi:hypothetical protein
MSSWLNNTSIKRNSDTTKLEPLFLKYDKEMFYRYLSNATTYFEYGSGGSTYQASLRKNLVNIYSVESDVVWHTKLKKIINNSSVKFIFSEMYTKPNTYGNPGPESTREDWIKYSSQICYLDSEDLKVIDFILIDGRFRVACCLKCFDIINSECFIAFDDFLNRPYYHIVLDYYNIIEKTTDNRMVILKKKSNISVPREIIEKYELDKN